MITVSIVGLGYIGLPTAIIAARHGFQVFGYDIHDEKIAKINSGDPVIQEPEVASALAEVIQDKLFSASTTLVGADVFVIAVPTPFKEEKKADLSYVWQALSSIAVIIKPGALVIIESTVPVGTTDQAVQFLEHKTGFKVGEDIFVAYCPERVLPGKIMQELLYNSRIIGGVTKKCLEPAKLFYQRFVKGEIYVTNSTTAEMVKLVENSSRDVSIAFANQVASMAYALKLNPFEVIELANKHPRVSILNPSCGVGGHCIAVDPWFLIESFPEQTKLLKVARLINDEKPHQVVAAVRNSVRHWQKHKGGFPTVLVLGLTYKANVDDLRESPALMIAKKLAKYVDLSLLVVDPHAPCHVINQLFYDCTVSLEEGMAQADIIVCLVAHAAFKLAVKNAQPHQKILDFCGLLHKSKEATTDHEFWPDQFDCHLQDIYIEGHAELLQEKE